MYSEVPCPGGWGGDTRAERSLYSAVPCLGSPGGGWGGHSMVKSNVAGVMVAWETTLCEQTPLRLRWVISPDLQ